MSELNQIVIRRTEERDLPAMADINADVFLGNRDHPKSAEEWMRCWFRAFPLYQYFVAEVDGEIGGYIGWQIHGGFLRAEPVIELEQLGVASKFQGKRIGPKLIDESIETVSGWLRTKNDRIESHISIIVWGYALNFNAMKVYAERFTEGVMGMRVQYGNRAENMLKWRIAMVRPIRE